MKDAVEPPLSLFEPVPDAPCTVTEITDRIKRLFEADDAFRSVTVIGEISNFKHHQGRHMYFVLKDEGAQIGAAFFSPANRALDFVPEDGAEVVATGSVSVYPSTGRYQLYVKSMRRSGTGLLWRRYEELKRRIVAEGLTDRERKRPLPAFPRRIGVVASSESAGLKDILNVLARRYPLATVVLEPVAVEGEGSAPSIARGLERMARFGNVDVVITGRGGGSIESLWGFNTEIVARAIAAFPVPVISAVGHETDTTIADLVADRRAATPTEAAELATPSVEEIGGGLAEFRERIEAALGERWEGAAERLALVARALRSPDHALAVRVERVDRLREALDARAAECLGGASDRLRSLAARREARSPERRVASSSAVLADLGARALFAAARARGEAERCSGLLGARLAGANPTAILGRGYAVVMKDGRSVRDAVQLARGDRIDVRLGRGSVEAEVTGTKEERS